jgi:DNA-binding XRE family transcriptional regulator
LILTSGERLKKIRNDLSLTQAELANILGFEWHKIKDIETGKQKLTPELAKKIEDLFSVNGWWLLTGQEQLISINALKSINAAMSVAESTPHGIEQLNALLDLFILDRILEKLLNAVAHTKEVKKLSSKSIFDKIKRTLLNVPDGKFLLILDEMLSKIKNCNSKTSKNILHEIIEGDKLHILWSQPLYKINEKDAFEFWIETLSEEECDFLVTNSEQISAQLSLIIPKLDKNYSKLDVIVNKKLIK